MNQNYLVSIYDVINKELIHVQNKITMPIHRPFGITFNNSDIYIAQSTGIIVLNENLEQKLLLENLWHGIHQILVKDEHLFIVSPYMNCLKIYNLITNNMNYFKLKELSFSEFPERFIGKDKLSFSYDLNHFNSIFINENRVFLTAHNHQFPSFILELTYPDLKLIEKHENLGKCIHNVYVENNEIFYLDSMGSKTIRSTKGANVHVTNKDKMFLRGFDVTEDYFVVGMSPEATRHERLSGNACIVIVDRKNNQIVEEITIENVGSINDLKIYNPSQIIFA